MDTFKRILIDTKNAQLKRFTGEKNQADQFSTRAKHFLIFVSQVFCKDKSEEVHSSRVNEEKVLQPPTVNNIEKHRYLSYAEADLLLQKLSGMYPYIHSLSLLALHCGLKLGEINNLTTGDLDFQNDIMLVRDQQGGSRQVYMTEEVRKMLLARKLTRPEASVFRGIRGREVKYIPKSFYRIVKKLGLNYGLQDKRDKVVFKTLRRTFGSWLALQGTPLDVIKDLMGHESIEETMCYAHLVSDPKKQAIKNLECHLRLVQRKNKDT